MSEHDIELWALALQLLAIVAAPFVALVPIIVWELYLRVRRDRRNVAKAIHIEVTTNAQVLLAAQRWREREPRKLPGDFALERFAFDAVADRIGELPPQVFGEVYVTYRLFAGLNHIAQEFDKGLTEYHSAPAGSDRHTHARTHLATALEAFDRVLLKAIGQSDTTMRSLYPLTFWPMRVRPGRDLSADEVAKHVDSIAAIREERLRGIEDAR